jgi:hypothetical protein
VYAKNNTQDIQPQQMFQNIGQMDVASFPSVDSKFLQVDHDLLEGSDDEGE